MFNDEIRRLSQRGAIPRIVPAGQTDAFPPCGPQVFAMDAPPCCPDRKRTVRTDAKATFSDTEGGPQQHEGYEAERGDNENDDGGDTSQHDYDPEDYDNSVYTQEEGIEWERLQKQRADIEEMGKELEKRRQENKEGRQACKVKHESATDSEHPGFRKERSSAARPTVPPKEPEKAAGAGTFSTAPSGAPSNVKKAKKLKEEVTADELSFKGLPPAHKMRAWKLYVYSKIASASTFPDKAVQWTSKAETTESHEELLDDTELAALSAKAATGVNKILHGGLHREIDLLEEQQLLEHRRLVNGPQLYWLTSHEQARSGADEYVCDIANVAKIALKPRLQDGF